MNAFLGILRYEYCMTIRLWALWVAYAILYAFALPTLISFLKPHANIPFDVWGAVGSVTYMFNLFMPAICGNLAADRIRRDRQLGLSELQHSTPLNDWAYIFGKYAGVLLAMLTPVILCMTAVGLLLAPLLLKTPWGFSLALPVGFLVINVPSYAFAIAISLACGLIIPIRVYQITFIVFWICANYLVTLITDKFTFVLVFTQAGQAAQVAFFTNREALQHITAEQIDKFRVYAPLNWAFLVTCIVAAMIVAHLYNQRQARLA